MSSTRSFAEGEILALYDAHVGHLIINRAQRKNAINAAMWAAIPEAIDWLTAQTARAIILKGAGEKDFSAGADIAEFETHRNDAETSASYEALNSKAFRAVRNASVPVIAAIRGVCYGGGFGLAAAADIRLADRSARFAVPAARLGLAYPVDAMPDIVAALGPQLAKLALFTTTELSAETLLEQGALLFLEDPGDLDRQAEAIAMKIATNAPLSVKASKAAINAVISGDAKMAAHARELGEATFSSRDYAEGRAAFKDRRKPHFTGE